MTEAFEMHFSEYRTSSLPDVTAASRKEYTSDTVLHFASGREWRLFMVQTGGVRLPDETLRKGDCLLLRPGRTVLAAFTARTVLCELDFRGTDVTEQLNADRHAGHSVFSCDVSRITAVMQEISVSPEGANAATFRTGLLLQLLSFLPSSEQLQETEAYGKQAMDYIRKHYMQPINVDDVAKAIGISRSWLYRCFMDYAEQSPTMFLRDVRMMRAKSLLRRTDMTVKEIAHAVGFEDPLYFSRVFSEYEGCSPRAYRK